MLRHNVLNAAKSASCSGCSRSIRCSKWPTRWTRGDSQRMLEIVQELERNGRSLQHFCRELARYFRNLLVARICRDGETRLIGASAAEQERLREMAARFSEEDLTRYLQFIARSV